MCWVGYLNFEGIWRAGVKERGGKQKDKKKLVFFVKKNQKKKNLTTIITLCTLHSPLWHYWIFLSYTTDVTVI